MNFLKSEFDLVGKLVLTFWTLQAPAFLMRMLYAAVCSVSAAHIKACLYVLISFNFIARTSIYLKTQIIIPNQILYFLFHLSFLYVTDLSEKII